MLDSERKIIRINTAMEQILPNKKEQIIGIPLTEFLLKIPHRGSEFLPEVERALLNSSQAPQTFEITLISRQNEKLPLLITISSMRDRGIVQGYVGIGMDLTSRKVIEDLQMREIAILKANEILKRSVKTISHEFRTPLSVLQMAASSIAKYKDKMTHEQSQKMFALITESTSTITKIIEEVTILSNLQEESILINLEKYSPFKLVNYILTLFNSQLKSKK